jgi:hypothetical protein
VKLLSWVFGAVLLPLLLSEFTELSPWLAECLVRRAARRIPEQERPDWEAEWLAELASKRGRLLKLLWALRRLPLLRRGPREMAYMLGATPASGIRARLRAAWQRLRLRPKAPAQELTAPEPGVVQAEVAHAAVLALEEAEGRRRTSERALRKAEADAAGAGQLVAARVEGERALLELDTRLAAARERHTELSEAAGAAANRLAAAREADAAIVDLDPDAPCSTCGQQLGAAHDDLRRRRADELAAATANATATAKARQEVVAAGKALAERQATLAGLLEQARAAETRAAKATALVEAAGAALELAEADVAARRRALSVGG